LLREACATKVADTKLKECAENTRDAQAKSSNEKNAHALVPPVRFAGARQDSGLRRLPDDSGVL
jgi:hypothetical protein